MEPDTDAFKFVFNGKIPIGISIDNIIEKNDGDVAIFSILLNKIKNIKPGQIILDVGAYEGVFSRVARHFCKNTVLAFEPNINTYLNLVKSIKNDEKENIYVYPLAISTTDGISYLEENDGSSNIRSNKGGMSVITKPLNDIIEKDKDIYFMKIDTEGCDLDVIDSARDFIERNALHNCVFEYSAYWVGNTIEESIVKSMPTLTYLHKKYKYMYSLSRNGIPYLVGPLLESDLEVFIIDHFERHLQTDIYVTNEPVDFLHVFAYERRKYFA